MSAYRISTNFYRTFAQYTVSFIPHAIKFQGAYVLFPGTLCVEVAFEIPREWQVDRMANAQREVYGTSVLHQFKRRFVAVANERSHGDVVSNETLHVFVCA